jgi:hypothetical protein
VSRIRRRYGTISRVRLVMPAALSAALALTLATPAGAELPLGAPEVVRPARPGDAHQRPRAMTEWWELVAIGRRPRQAVRIRMARGSRIGAVDVDVPALRWHDRLAQSIDTRRRRRLTATGPEGTTRLRRVRRGWVLTMAGPIVSGRLRLTRAQPGPTALRWDLGEELRWPEWEPVDMSWSALAATSTVSGTLTVEGRRVRLRRWRGSLEHVWGRFTVDDEAWDHLNAFTIHERGGGATVAFGLNRTDTTTGAGARDAQWLGVLARVSQGRMSICRPTIHRRRWKSPNSGWQVYALTLRSRCGRERLVFRALDETYLWGGQGIAHFEYGWPARAPRRGRGIATVLGGKF